MEGSATRSLPVAICGRAGARLRRWLELFGLRQRRIGVSWERVDYIAVLYRHYHSYCRFGNADGQVHTHCAISRGSLYHVSKPAAEIFCYGENI